MRISQIRMYIYIKFNLICMAPNIFGAGVLLNINKIKTTPRDRKKA